MMFDNNSDLRIIPNGEGKFDDLLRKPKGHVIAAKPDGSAITISALSGGMVGGAPSVMIRIDLPDGKTVLAQTSLKSLGGAVDIFRSHYKYNKAPDALYWQSQEKPQKQAPRTQDDLHEFMRTARNVTISWNRERTMFFLPEYVTSIGAWMELSQRFGVLDAAAPENQDKVFLQFSPSAAGLAPYYRMLVPFEITPRSEACTSQSIGVGNIEVMDYFKFLLMIEEAKGG
jgi:hypothetical protein